MKSLAEQKAELRRYIMRDRDGIPAALRGTYDVAIHQRLLALPELQHARQVFLFLSFASEVDTHALVDTLVLQGKLVAVPKQLDSGAIIALPFRNREELEPGPLGILAPRYQSPVVTGIDVCITPGLGFTLRGERLGYGKGCYDNWFRDNPVGCKIALAYECQVLEQIPVSHIDVPVDWIVTEERLIRCSPPDR